MAYVWRDPARRRTKPPTASPTAIICRAMANPGLYADKRMHETDAAWQARAILAAIEPPIRADERRHIIKQARARNGDPVAALVAEIIGEQP
jgi:hypothetical protein